MSITSLAYVTKLSFKAREKTTKTRQGGGGACKMIR